MGDLVPVHEKLQRFFGDINFDFSSPKHQKKTSVHWLHSKHLLHEGYLRKKAPHRQNKWQRRYTMLFGHYVFYFKHAKSKVPSGWFSLRPYDKVSEEFGDTPENQKFNIRIKNSRNNDIRVYCFQAANYTDLLMWKACFQATIDYILSFGNIQKSCQEHLLNTKLMQSEAKNVIRKPDYSFVLDSRITEPELSRLARQLGHGWKSFAREQLRIPQYDLERIGEQHRNREEEVYAVLLQWRRKERDKATKGKLIDLLRNFEEVDYCAWRFLEPNGGHDYTNERMDDHQDSSDENMCNNDVYDDIELTSQCSEDDFSTPLMQLEEEESESEDSQDETPGLLLPPNSPSPGRQRFNSNPHYTWDLTPGPALPPNTLSPGGLRIHSDPHHTTVEVPPSLPHRPLVHESAPPPQIEVPPSVPRRPFEHRLASPPQVHFNQNDNTVSLQVEAPPSVPRRPLVPGPALPPQVHFNQNHNNVGGPPSLPRRPLVPVVAAPPQTIRTPAPPLVPLPRTPHLRSNSNQHHNEDPPPVPRHLPPVNEFNERIQPHNAQQGNMTKELPPVPRHLPAVNERTHPRIAQQGNMAQGRPVPPRRPLPGPGAEPRSSPLFQKNNLNFAAELNSKLAMRR